MSTPPTPGAELVPMTVDPVVVLPRRIPWGALVAAAVVGVVVSALVGVAAIVAGRTTSAAVAMLIFGVALFPVLTHLEMDA